MNSKLNPAVHGGVMPVQTDYIPDNGAPAVIAPQVVWTDEASSRARRWLSRNGFHPSDVRAMEHWEILDKMKRHYPEKGQVSGSVSYLWDGCPLGTIPSKPSPPPVSVDRRNGSALCQKCMLPASEHGSIVAPIESFPALMITHDGAEVVAVDIAHDSGDVDSRRELVHDHGAGDFSLSIIPLSLVLASHELLRSLVNLYAAAPVPDDAGALTRPGLSAALSRAGAVIRPFVAAGMHCGESVPPPPDDTARKEKARKMALVEVDHALTWAEMSQDVRNRLTRISNILEGAPES